MCTPINSRFDGIPYCFGRLPAAAIGCLAPEQTEMSVQGEIRQAPESVSGGQLSA